MDSAALASFTLPVNPESFLTQDFGTPMEEFPAVDQASEPLPLQGDSKLRVDGAFPAFAALPSKFPL